MPQAFLKNLSWVISNILKQKSEQHEGKKKHLKYFLLGVSQVERAKLIVEVKMTQGNQTRINVCTQLAETIDSKVKYIYPPCRSYYVHFWLDLFSGLGHY